VRLESAAARSISVSERPSQMTYTIRNAQSGDVPAFAQVEINAGELFKTIGLDDLAGDFSSPDFVMSFVQTDGAFVAVHTDGTIAGFALAFMLHNAIHLQEMSVDPAHGRRGLGGQLLDAVASWARQRGYTRLTLATFRDVPWNAPFYARHGYKIVSTDKWMPGFHILREHEEQAGLPIERRCFMERILSPQ
jgi:GNAT superfamily N-acetyltransferase